MPEQVNQLNIPSIQGKRNIKFLGADKTVITGTAPMPMGIDTAATMQGSAGMQNVQQAVSETQLGNRVKNSSEMGQSPYTVPVTLATWYAIAQGMDKFGEKCNGEYEKSILGKITDGADKISNAVTENKIVKSRAGRFFNRIYKSVQSYTDRVTNNPKNRILYALRNTHTRPECKLVIAPAAGVDGFLVMDTTKTVFEEFLKPAKEAIQLRQYGKDQKYINNFLEKIKNLTKKEKLQKLQLEELQFFGYSEADIAGKSADELAKLLREAKIKGLGFKDAAQYEKFLSEEYTLSHMKELKDILRNGNQNLKILIWKKDGALGKITNHLFGRELGISELANKFEMLTTGAKTKFGKFAGKAFAYLTEGCTNRFAGGKVAVLMQAFIFADMFIHTAKAPKGEKGKTLVERFVNDFTYFLALPLGIGLMHMAGGLKYAGMTKEQVKAYRENLKFLNENRKNYSKKGYDLRKKVLDRQLKAGVKNPFVKLIKKAANLLTIGLERTKPYISKDKFNLNFLRKSKYFGHNALGYIIRFAIPMCMLSPLFAKWTTTAAHKIFGRPTNSVLDEDKESDETETQDQTGIHNQVSAQDTQPAVSVQDTAQQQPFTQRNNPQDYKSDTNLIKMTINGQKAAETEQDPNKEYEPARTYIPSPRGIVLQNPDTSGLDEAFANADSVEKYGYEVLKSV